MTDAHRSDTYATHMGAQGVVYVVDVAAAARVADAKQPLPLARQP